MSGPWWSRGGGGPDRRDTVSDREDMGNLWMGRRERDASRNENSGSRGRRQAAISGRFVVGLFRGSKAGRR
jgi:hypothetical protein